MEKTHEIKMVINPIDIERYLKNDFTERFLITLNSHYYIVSDTYINKGEWCIEDDNMGNYHLVQWELQALDTSDYYKIDSTTNKSLGLGGINSSIVGDLCELYVLSDESKSEGDYCLFNDELIRLKHSFVSGSELCWEAENLIVYGDDLISKVIMTTDRSLGLPLINETYIKEYLEKPTSRVRVLHGESLRIINGEESQSLFMEILDSELAILYKERDSIEESLLNMVDFAMKDLSIINRAKIEALESLKKNKLDIPKGEYNIGRHGI